MCAVIINHHVFFKSIHDAVHFKNKALVRMLGSIRRCCWRGGNGFAGFSVTLINDYIFRLIRFNSDNLNQPVLPGQQLNGHCAEEISIYSDEDDQCCQRSGIQALFS